MGGVSHNKGGLSQQPIIMINPPGANHNRKAFVVRPPGAYRNGGGVNENFTPVNQPIEFFRNYTKLAIKASVGKSKINSAKELPSVAIEPGTFCILL